MSNRPQDWRANYYEALRERNEAEAKLEKHRRRAVPPLPDVPPLGRPGAERMSHPQCQWCGDTFEPIPAGRRYCSVLCRSRMDLHRRTCTNGDACTEHERSTVPGRRLPTLTERLTRHIDASAGPDACWPWTGARNRWGYGRTYIRVDGQRREVNASRAVFIAVNGPLPPELHVLHSCDNPPCSNPRHLRAGTHDENMADRSRRGRYASGDEVSWAHHLSPELIRQIRAAYKPRTNGRGTPALAARFGISRSVIQRIVTHTSRWDHPRAEEAS